MWYYETEAWHTHTQYTLASYGQILFSFSFWIRTMLPTENKCFTNNKRTNQLVGFFFIISIWLMSRFIGGNRWLIKQTVFQGMQANKLRVWYFICTLTQTQIQIFIRIFYLWPANKFNTHDLYIRNVKPNTFLFFMNEIFTRIS